MRQRITRFFILIIIFCSISLHGVSQITSIDSISYHSARVNVNNPNNQQLSLHVFTDTIIFKEDFSGFPHLLSGIAMCQSGVELNIPSSYTLFSGCKAKNLYSNYGDSCYFLPDGEFITPCLNLVKSNNSYRIRLFIKNTSSNKKRTLDIYQTDSNNNYTFHSTVTVNANSTKSYDSVFSCGVEGGRIKFKDSNGSLVIDDIIISYLSSISCEETSSPFNFNSSSFILSSLKPNTRYFAYIEGNNNVAPFSTLGLNLLDSVDNISPNKATIHFSATNNIQNKRLIIKKKANGCFLAKDLFFSEITTAKNTDINRAIELFNGTGRDIALKDYTINFAIHLIDGSFSNNKIFSFQDKDTIKNNSCVVVMEKLNNLYVANSGVFYRNTALNNSGSNLMKGNEAIALINGEDTVDIFGNFNENISTASGGWTSGNMRTVGTTLRRDSSVVCGVMTNPTSGFPTLSTQWTQIGGVNDTSRNNFLDFGQHTFINQQQNLNLLVLDTLLSPLDTSFTIRNLDTNTLYEAFAIITQGSNVDTTNSLSFTTGKITQRTMSGDWNDTSWTNNVPQEKDIAVINNNQIVVIPQDTKAKCYDLLLKDDGNGEKASLINKGTLNIKDLAKVEMYIKGKENNLPTYNLYGVPIDVNSIRKDSIFAFVNLTPNDSISCLDTLNSWFSCNNLTINDTSVLYNGRGFVLNFLGDKTLEFKGKLNDSLSYLLLNDAPFQSNNPNKNFYLLANPYPFSLSLKNITMHNVSNIQVYNKQTKNFELLTSENSLPAYCGFVCQVNGSNNSLTISKDSVNNDITSIENPMQISVNSSYGNDKTMLMFDSTATLSYDMARDNHHFSNFLPYCDIFSKINNENYLLKYLPTFSDSILVDIDFIAKHSGTYTLNFSYDNSLTNFQKIILCDKQTNNSLVDFLIDSSYSLNTTQQLEEKHFTLKIYKTLSALDYVSLLDNSIQIQQKENRVTIGTNDKVKTISLYSLQGQKLLEIRNQNTVLLPNKGVFLLKVITNTRIKTSKIIYL